MKKISVIIMTLLLSLLCTTIYAVEKDADGCKDHPLIPRMTEYYIMGCSDTPANSDIDIVKGESTQTIHIEGNSSVLLFKPQPELTKKPSEVHLKSDFEAAVKKQGGELLGETYGQKWPVYYIAKDGKEYWVILLVNSGEYFTGSYTCRIVEKRKI
jgi:OmpA-OmpF porin, OOP family